MPAVPVRALLLACAVAAPALAAGDERRDGAWTVYAGRMASEGAWTDIVTGPADVQWTDSYVAVAAYAHPLPWRVGGVEWEWEGQVARWFGDQRHWEFNAPLVARFTRFPWRERIATGAACGLGVSYATALPPVEVQLEGSSERFLAYWFLELTAGPPRADWAVSLRIHHRSAAFGLFGEDGGMNAVALGIRKSF